jgi:hypothetical protein
MSEKKPAGRKSPTKKQYEKAEVQVALSYCPEILPCSFCGWPCVVGIMCSYCEAGYVRSEDR